MANRTKLVLGLVGAAAAGVVIGLLLAPEKGSATRKKITETATDWGEHLSNLFANAKGEIDNLRKKGANVVTDATNKF